MTVDRSYLPYRSARNYQDRKMAKWMGFFLSEHTTALTTEAETIDFSQSLPLGEKLLLLNQLYLQKLSGIFQIIQDEKSKEIRGKIDSVQANQVGVQSENAHYFISIKHIISIKLEEELDDGF
ncbi:DUF2642 domain-containing protein [Aerococcaceae bacterium INB8]|uniref:DUF2642 domain-containing protein n=1 Tax=Ruoffia halotolerans TaxID=2748684 RepID=A0A839A5I3_9LACT|nr:DUF2642 domain-containing protein [Ruoffia halotolerans]MBA5729277.1 DUF2642 domain-containing protein [Ruoffia halotolerans]